MHIIRIVPKPMHSRRESAPSDPAITAPLRDPTDDAPILQRFGQDEVRPLMNDLGVLPHDLPSIKAYGREYMQVVLTTVLANIHNLEPGQIYTAEELLGAEAWDYTTKAEHTIIGKIVVVLVELGCLPLTRLLPNTGNNHARYVLNPRNPSSESSL